MKISRRRLRCIYNALLIIMTVIVMISPEGAANGSLALKGTLLLLWYADSFLYIHGKGRFKGLNFSVVLVFFFLFQLLYEFLEISSVAIGNYVGIWIFFDLIIKALYVKQYYDEGLKRALIRVFQIVISINIIWNIYIGNVREDIHLDIIANPQDYVGMNVATTTFYNMLAFFIGFNVLLILKEQKVKSRLIDLAAIVLSYWFMFSFTPRLTAVFISIVLILLILLFHVKKKVYRVLLGIGLVIVIVFMFTNMIEVIINLLPERIALRVQALILVDNNMGSDYLSRFDLAFTSLKTFTSSIHNFMFGAGYHFGKEYTKMIGQHSLIPDYLAAYGCVGLIFVCYFFYKLKKLLLVNVTSDFNKNAIHVFLFGFLLISLMSRAFVPEIAFGTVMLLVLAVDYKEEMK